MKLIFLMLFCCCCRYLGAQQHREVFGYARPPALPDSVWNRLSVREKITYCLYNADQYRQICGRYDEPHRIATGKFIYRQNYHFNSFGEYVYSKRQLDFLTAYSDSVDAYLEEDLFLNKSGLYYWDFLLRQLPARREVIDLLLKYWQMQETATSEPLNLIISMMIRDGFEDFLESSLGKVLNAGSEKIPYHSNNRKKLGVLINEYMKSQHVGYRGHWNRISDPQIFSATIEGDSLYAKTRRIGDARLSRLSPLQLLNYCIFNPELYYQICYSAGFERRDHRQYIYASSPVGSIDAYSYSERQIKALLQQQDSCQALLMELLLKGDCRDGLILITNTWQAIPWLVKQHRMYGSRTGGAITTILGLLQQNKGTGFDDFVFDRETVMPGTTGRIKKTPRNENAILDFAMDLYRLKQPQL